MGDTQIGNQAFGSPDGSKTCSKSDIRFFPTLFSVDIVEESRKTPHIAKV